MPPNVKTFTVYVVDKTFNLQQIEWQNLILCKNMELSFREDNIRPENLKCSENILHSFAKNIRSLLKLHKFIFSLLCTHADFHENCSTI